MGKKVTTLVTGLLFGLSLIGMFYFYLVIGIALAFGGAKTIFEYMFIVSPILGALAIVGASLCFKTKIPTRVLLIIPFVAFLLITIYSFILGFFSILYLLICIAIFALGLTSIIFAFLIKYEKRLPRIIVENVEKTKENSDENQNI